MNLPDVSPVAALLALAVFGVLFATPLHRMRGVLLVWPGTVAHELAHWSIALLTGCRPNFPNLWAKRNPDGSITLGQVSFQAKPFFSAWVALAPFLLLGPASYLLVVSPSNTSVLVAISNGVLAGYFAWGSLPSSQDLKIALQDPIGLLAVIFAGWGLHTALG
jgi:hypothetical protein